MKALAILAAGIAAVAGFADAGAWKAEYAEKFPMPVFRPDAYHHATNRWHTGIPSLAVAPNGRLWATWYTGISNTECHHNYQVLSTSGDGGKTWKETYIADPDGTGTRRSFDGELWVDPSGRLHWTWTDRDWSKGGPKTDVLWRTILPDAGSEPTEDAPKAEVIGRGVMMCKPTMLSWGELAYPVSRWYQEGSAEMWTSKDCGATLEKRGAVNLPKGNRLYDEHRFVELKNGDLWALVRGKGENGLFEAFSKDRGATWTPGKAARLKHTSSRVFIERLKSGALLLVKHGRPEEDVGRSKLMAFVSDDDGQTWKGGLMLDERDTVSYPDGQQHSDGTIYLTYDFSRLDAREILFCKFTEADVRAGRDTGTFEPRRLISKSTGPRVVRW